MIILDIKNSNKKLLATIIGGSMGMIIGSQMVPSNKKKIMKKAKTTTENIKEGLNSLLN